MSRKLLFFHNGKFLLIFFKNMDSKKLGWLIGTGISGGQMRDACEFKKVSPWR
jgi:hypothetical protein